MMALARSMTGILSWRKTLILKPWLTQTPNLALNIHTSPQRRINPILVALFKPASKIAAMVTGRQVRIWYRKLPETEKAKFRARIRRSQHLIAASGLGFVGLLGYLYASHIETCPITGRRRFIALKDNQLKKIATAEFEMLMETYKQSILPESHPAYARVARVGNQILRANKTFHHMDTKDWTITVIASSERNAFVLPSGNIFVFTGMLEICSNDDQLGIVLSHELSHCLLDHVAEKISYANFINLIILIPLALLWALLPNDGIALVSDWFFKKVIDIMLELPFSRQMETEADEVGLTLAAKSCLDIREAPVFWGKMSLLEETEQEQIPELISTHPAHENRQKHLEDLLPSALTLRQECGCYRLSGRNPGLEFIKYAEMLRKAYVDRLKGI